MLLPQRQLGAIEMLPTGPAAVLRAYALHYYIARILGLFARHKDLDYVMLELVVVPELLNKTSPFNPLTTIEMHVKCGVSLWHNVDLPGLEEKEELKAFASEPLPLDLLAEGKFTLKRDDPWVQTCMDEYVDCFELMVAITKLAMHMDSCFGEIQRTRALY